MAALAESVPSLDEMAPIWREVGKRDEGRGWSIDEVTVSRIRGDCGTEEVT